MLVNLLRVEKESFAEFCKTNSLTQAAAFRRAIQSLELESVKKITPDRKSEIEEIQRCVDLILSKYADSIRYSNAVKEQLEEENQKLKGAEETKRAQLSERLVEAQEFAKQEEKNHLEAIDKIEKLEKELNFINGNSEARINDKELLITSLKEKISSLEHADSKCNELELELKILKQKYDANMKENDKVVEDLKQKHDEKVEKLKDDFNDMRIKEIKKHQSEHNAECELIRNDYQKKLDMERESRHQVELELVKLKAKEEQI